MAKDRYSVLSTPAFERTARKLIKQVPHIEEWLAEVTSVLQSDPYNLTKQHQIKKLHGVLSGEGQWRFRLGVYRLRYDIDGHTVILRVIAHRREVY